MSDHGDLSHRQEREKKKEDHAQPTRGKYSPSRLTWTVVVGVILIGTAVLLWTVLLPAMRGPG